MAHLRHLNHMTLDTGKDRRILVSSANIVCTVDPKRRKCWNERPARWKFDPMKLVIKVPEVVARYHIAGMMKAQRLPVPVSWKRMPARNGFHEYLVEFDKAGDNATVWDVLQGDQFYEHGKSAYVDVTYQAWDEHGAQNHFCEVDPDLVDTRYWWPHTLSEQERRDLAEHERWKLTSFEGERLIQSNWTYSSRPRRRSNSRGESSDGDAYGSGASVASSKRSLTTYLSDSTPPDRAKFGVGLSELGASVHEDTRDELYGSTLPKRRKRFPKVNAGYQCQEPGCDKVFNCNGDRTKHARIHWPESEYPHACTYCDKRFIHRKDATRHEKVHIRKWLPSKLVGRL